MDIGKQAGLSYGSPTRNAFGDALEALGGEYADLVVVDGDVGNSTRTQAFGEAYPDRYFNVGIAESNLVGTASGLAMAGKDVVAASFACFLLCNAYDQLRMSVAFPNVPVKLVGSHGGISIGEDGPSQMAIEDFALATSLPNVTVLVPADAPAAAAMTRAMLEHDGPTYMRTGRPKVPVVYANGAAFRIGRANEVREGTDVTIVACGLMVAAALDAAADLADEGIQARVLDMHTIKPLDEHAIARAAEETGAIVTAEEHLIQGGLGASVTRLLAERHPVPVAMVGVADRYAQSGSAQELLDHYGLTGEAIARAARSVRRRRA